MRAPPIREERSPHFFVEVAATAVFWGLWAYFIAPLLSLLLWAGGVHVFVEEMITLGGYEALLEKLIGYGMVVLAIAIAVNAWVLWNVRRYGRRNTRVHELAAVTLAESAEAAGMEAGELQRCQNAKRLLVAFDDNDRIQVRDWAERGNESAKVPV